MQTLTYSVIIDADRDRIWEVLWNDKTYREWTKVFTDGSHAVSDWNEGSPIEFRDGKGSGMFSEIVKLEPSQLMMFQHLGSIKDGEHVEFSGDLKDWTGSFETYRLADADSGSKLTVEIDSSENFREFFDEKFPQALNKVKTLSEAKQ